MKTFLVAAVLAVTVTPVMAGNGWNYGSKTPSIVNCKQNSYGSKYNDYNSWSYGSNYGSNYGSRTGSSKFNHWPTSSYNVWPTRFNNASSYYDYGAPSVRNTRYDNHHKNDMTFSPWSPTRNYHHGHYGY